MKLSVKNRNAAIYFIAILALIGVVLLAVDTAFRFIVLQFHPDGVAVAANFSWMIIQWSFMFPALLIGVFVSVILTQCHPRNYLIAMACIQGLVMARARIFSPISTVPTELWVMTFLVVPLFFCMGPWMSIRQRWESKNIGTEHSQAL